jgi:rhomboid protease GluP
MKQLKSERWRRDWVIYALIALCALPELALLGADWGLWGSARWRPLTYQNGAFWVGLLYGWRPNYALQPYTMYVSYAFLHSGFMHFLINMITLWSLGKSVALRTGQAQMLLIYIASILGGAWAFGYLGPVVQPMVGASGALFGLAGAWVVWDVWDAMRARPGIETLAYAVLWPVLFLVLMNIVMYWASDGQLAWETHLGGFVAGLAVAIILINFRAPNANES